MNRNKPWDNIKTPSEDLNVRQIRDSKHLPMYWGKDSNGRCVFLLELHANGIEIFKKNAISINGIKIDYRKLTTSGNQGLLLVLEKHIDQDLFYSLCETLIYEVSGIDDPLIGLSVALSQIKRWKAFMAGKKWRELTPEEVRGLFSELKFLQQVLIQIRNEIAALEAWQGPASSHQDFIFSDTSIEIKSISGRERNTVKISSEDQLESLNSHLFLKLYRLIDNTNSENALSLNELIKNISHNLVEPESIEFFNEKLAAAGYVEIPVYDNPKFTVAEELTYRVDKQFPRIIRSKIHPGISRVHYEIKLESIQQYLCSNNFLWEA